MRTKSCSWRGDTLAHGVSGALDRHKTAAPRALWLATDGVTLAITSAIFVRDGISPLLQVGGTPATKHRRKRFRSK